MGIDIILRANWPEFESTEEYKEKRLNLAAKVLEDIINEKYKMPTEKEIEEEIERDLGISVKTYFKKFLIKTFMSKDITTIFVSIITTLIVLWILGVFNN